MYTWFVWVLVWWRWWWKSSWGKIGDIEFEPRIRRLVPSTLSVCTWWTLHRWLVCVWRRGWWKSSWGKIGDIEFKPRIRWLQRCILSVCTWFACTWWKRWWKFFRRKARDFDFGSKLLHPAVTCAGKDGTLDRLLQWNFNNFLRWWLIATNHWSKRHLSGGDRDSLLDTLLWRKDKNKMSY